MYMKMFLCVNRNRRAANQKRKNKRRELEDEVGIKSMEAGGFTPSVPNVSDFGLLS
jgi:hypothetical protein